MGGRTVTKAETPPIREGQGRSATRGRLEVLAALVAAWVVPLLTHLVKLDLILPFLLVLGAASLIRAGRTLFDRLALGTVLTVGGGLGAAIGFGAWPWGLHPVPMAGSGFTVMVVAAVLLRRRPELPTRVTAVDALTVGLTAVTGLLMARPLIGRSPGERLTMYMGNEDGARHFAFFDTIRRIGSYMFQQPASAAQTMNDFHTGYTQGWHMAAAMFDNFVMSSATPDSTTAELSRYLNYYVGSYVLCCLAVLWAVRHVAGPRARFWPLLPLGVFVVGTFLYGELISVYLSDFVAEVSGLAFLAVVIALLVRPLHRTREQVVVLSAAIIGLALCYRYFVPVVALATLYWAFQYRRRLVRVWPLALVAALVTAPIVATAQLVESGILGQYSYVLAPGGVVRVNRTFLVGVFLFVLFGALSTRRWWRLPATRTMLVALGTATVMAVGVGGYQIYKTGSTLYSFDKTLHALAITLLVSLGLCVPAVGRALNGVAASRRSWGAALPALALAAAGLSTFGLADRSRSLPGVSYQAGRYGVFTGHPTPVLHIIDQVPDPERKRTLVTIGKFPSYQTLYLSVLQRDYNTDTWGEYIWLLADRSPAEFRRHILESGTNEYQVITDNPALLEELRGVARQHPGIGLEVIDARTLKLG